ncbi:PTS lactose/cellobiose transporter subunit IIA [Escherichia marmotae]|uniref:PTS lactose/cellobiose transporter subunit IIA n=1 Tax=Escherichia marmotae TaxID=1499973 RepID=UPI00056DE8AB|nr:PTS lactose/cellobiose transporter subunit IIA [Escherichia marmotae]AUT26319.1 PTS N N'-diacetylchitobiose transporter subunit IIA [Escherichia marmotae]
MMDLENIPDTQTEAEELEEVVMDQSRMALNEAHLVQTKLIEGDQGEGKMKVSLVLVHAQDHLMTSMLARELISELIELHEKLKA